ncbi:complement factor H-like [Uloborus diversus]|uniref:complement factor H-like n=1 Tax=Uloborus diversus TaxID=327109 RepID=UPI0024096AAE|nr:complement factor H-like [Uloborus diversus]
MKNRYYDVIRAILSLGKTTEENDVSCLDGKWSEDFTCVSSGCATDPPPTKNGNIHTKRDFHGGTVTYICNTLFSKVKSGNVTCLFGQWEGVTPVCEKKHCLVSELNDPGLKDSLRIYWNGVSYDPSCKAGYETSTVANKLVCRNGNWTGHIPPCQPASCRNDPPRINNGRAIPKCRTHGCAVTYICEHPFTLKGNSTVTCQYGGWVGNPPTCSTDICRVPRISNGEIGNYVTNYGQRVFQKSRSGEEMYGGVEYHLRCYDNYHVAGSRSQEIRFYCIDGVLSESLECASCK